MNRFNESLGPCLMLLGVTGACAYWFACFVIGVGIGSFLRWLQGALAFVT